MSNNSTIGLQTIIDALFRNRSVNENQRTARAIRLLFSFSLLIVLPNLILGYFAVASIRDSIQSIESEVEPEATAMLTEIQARESEIFIEFEETIASRLRRGLSPVTNLQEVSPHLLTAFQLDAERQVVEPFAPPEPLISATQNHAYRRAWLAATSAERRGDYVTAAAKFQAAIGSTGSPRLKGQAALALARLRADEGDLEPLEGLVDEYGDIRDPQGFRIGDIARLNIAERELAQSTDGLDTLRELAEFLIDETKWTLFEGAEPSVAQRVLTMISTASANESIDKEWLARASRRLENQSSQLFWSGRLADEMSDVASAPLPNTGIWSYLPSNSTGVLWAIRRSGEDTLIYAFNTNSLIDELGRTATRLASPSQTLTARILAADTSSSPEVSFASALEHVSSHTIQVAAINPEALQTAQNRRIFGYFVIILAVVATSVIGVVLTYQLVTRELDAARVKTDFAANVSHELRSPITQIRLKGEALQLDLLTNDEERQEHYDAIVRESERLSRLVDNVLDFAAIERGVKRYTRRPEDLIDIVEAAVQNEASRFAANEIQVEINIPADLPVLWVDRVALSQVFTNLLSNAAKYGGEGKWVGVDARTERDHVVISVSDRGMGISPDDQAHIFDDFFRSSRPEVRRRKGTGIGLTIVRYIVEAHGGTISVTSAPGRGSSFIFQLPLRPEDGPGA